MLHGQTVTTETLGILKVLMSQKLLSDYWLVGGTSLALQIGHRRSIDLDLFGQTDLKFDQISEVITSLGYQYTWLNRSKSVKTMIIEGVKTDLVTYKYDWIRAGKIENEIRLSSKEDIAAMKLSAITGRGSRKDFVDLHFLLKEFTLGDMLGFYSDKFPDGSPFLVLKSLTYFEDAESQVMPDMLVPTSWNLIKDSILKAHNDYLKSL